jgi:hypothetical protein
VAIDYYGRQSWEVVKSCVEERNCTNWKDFFDDAENGFLAEIAFSESGDKNLSGFRNLKGLFGR